MAEESAKNRIVVGVDGSEPGMAALLWAAGQASALGAQLVVVTAWIHDGMLDDASLTRALEDARKVHLGELEAQVEKVLGERAPGLDLLCKAPDGDPAQVLIEESREANMLVVGSHGTGRLHEILVGSVSKACLRHASCPVVVIPAPARAKGSRLGRMLLSTAYTPGPVL